MRLNNQVVRSRSSKPLNSIEFLDLSNLGLVFIGRLSSCPKLQTLVLRENRLEDASGLDSCKQLWHLDLSNNQLRSVEGLSRFLALGTLVLSNNNLGWQDLVHIQHMHILNLSLHGNPQLENDPFYRIHVIDCLPNVWMLDGRLVTSAERIQVRQFFQDSALTDRPVRRKLKKDGFVPSSLKKIEIDGIFGSKTVQLMTTFPKNAVLNIETDWKRLNYLASDVQEDILLECRYSSRNPDSFAGKQNFLVDLFSARLNDRERCNMVLLLLVASLEFVLPTHLVRDTLDTGKLLKIGSVNAMDLFLLPRALRCKVVSLLLSAVRVDRDENEDGGLYPKLYLCLYHIVSELTHLSETSSALQPSKLARSSLQLRDYKCLLATEVVQLMCIVPSFFDYLDRDMGVMNLVRIATADADINEKLAQISGTKISGDEDVADCLLVKVQEQLQNLTNKAPRLSPCDKILSKSGALPMKGENTPVIKADYLVRGVGSPDDEPPVLNPRKKSAKSRSRFPHLGDKMLLGPQTVGKIISLPQPTMALVIIDAVPVASGAVEHKLKESDNHYTYVNMSHLTWDPPTNMWKPLGTIGDKFTLQSADDFVREVGTAEQTDDSYRPGTPESSVTPNLRASTPLIYTPRQRVFVPTDLQQKSKARRPQRPLSSVYKERLKLSLDLSRRAQSAGSRRPVTASHSAKSSTQKQPKQGIMPGPPADAGTRVGMRVDLKAMVLDGQSDTTGTARSPGPDAGGTYRAGVAADSGRKVPSAACSDQESGRAMDSSARTEDKENAQRLGLRTAAQGGPEDAGLPYDLQMLGPAGRAVLEEKTSGGVPRLGAAATDVSPSLSAGMPASTGGGLLSTEGGAGILSAEGSAVPRGGGVLSARGNAAAAEATEVDALLKSIQYTPRTVMKSYSGNQLAGRARPVSAMEHQAVMNGVGRTRSDSGFHTDFQIQRINAWKRTARQSPLPKGAQAVPPPPQRPSSPNHSDHTSGEGKQLSDSLDSIPVRGGGGGGPRVARVVVNRRITPANLWLAGGRDLYWEQMRSRPKSGHTPGWKEGLPENMKKPRPRSAAARTFRKSKTPGFATPSSHTYDMYLHGGSTGDASELPDLGDFPSSLYQNGTLRRQGSQHGPYDEDPLPDAVQDEEESAVSAKRPADDSRTGPVAVRLLVGGPAESGAC